MLGNILSEKYIALAALSSSILSLYLAISNTVSRKRGKFLVSIDIATTIEHTKDNIFYGYKWLTIKHYSCRHYGSINIANLSETAKTVESVLLKLPNASPKNPELDYLIISKQPILIEPEENHKILLDFTNIDIPSYLRDSQKAYVLILDMYGEKWTSKERITIGFLRKLRRESMNSVSSRSSKV